LGPPERRLLEQLAATVDRDRLRADLEALPAPRHRLSEPDRTDAAERRIAARLNDAGWRAERRPFDGGANVVALREGAERSALAVIAHHDTVAGSGGADDNGSGVVALIELARLLAPFRFKRSIVLAAVDLEETGRFEGSAALIQTYGPRLVGAVVFESLAFVDARPGSQRIPPGLSVLYPEQLERARANALAGTWTLLVYRSTGLPLARAVAAGFTGFGRGTPLVVRDPLDLPLIGRALPYLVPTVRHFARSDHTAFWRNGIPAILLTDTADLRNPRYHTPFDLPATLDYDRLADTVVATAFAICRLAGGEPLSADEG
ncbi:MAG TPA: M28 family peptidase, partial [Candidatus Limnocylindria bacterium]|nr:M28 family peptidase [Candidatus Limnocylindria bacterium]